MTKVKLSLLLRKFTNGEEVVEVSGETPADCLLDLKARYPGIEGWLYDKDGGLKRQVWVFLNEERVYGDEMAKKLRDGDELSVVLAVAGG